MIDIDPTTIPLGYTYDDAGNVLTYRHSDGSWYKYTRDVAGNIMTFRHRYGYWYKYTRDAAGRRLTCKNVNGLYSYTYDAAGGCTVTKSHNHEAHHD